MFFVNRTQDAPQHLACDSHGDKIERNHSSDTTETSGGHLEAGLVKPETVVKPGLARRFTKHARQRTKSLRNWSAAQSRSVWAGIISAVAGIVVILVLIALLIYFNIHLRRQIPRNDMQRIVASWGTPGSPTEEEARYPTDFSRDITPIPCHSHNDYQRKVPLYDALAAGCTGVEADVWLRDNDLLVGHSSSALTPARTLRSLYINPLVSILAHQNPPPQNRTTAAPPSNGVFSTNPTTPLTLLIDLKTAGPATLPVVLAQLEPLRSRGYLTHFNGSAVVPGAVTVVGTGNTPFEQLTANDTYRDLFYDAPLADLWGETAPSDASRYTAANSYYASVDFAVAVGAPWHGSLAPGQVEVVRGQVGAAGGRGLRARYWNTPGWPVGVRDHVWDVLVKEGVGMLNVDDLEGARTRDWGGGMG